MSLNIRFAPKGRLKRHEFIALYSVCSVTSVAKTAFFE